MFVPKDPKTGKDQETASAAIDPFESAGQSLDTSFISSDT